MSEYDKRKYLYHLSRKWNKLVLEDKCKNQPQVDNKNIVLMLYALCKWQKQTSNKINVMLIFNVGLYGTLVPFQYKLSLGNTSIRKQIVVLSQTYEICISTIRFHIQVTQHLDIETAP